MPDPARRRVGPVRFTVAASLRVAGAALMLATGLALLAGLGVVTYLLVDTALTVSLGDAFGWLLVLFVAGRFDAPLAFVLGGGVAGLFLSLGSELLDHAGGPLGFGGMFDAGGWLDLGGLADDLGGGFWDGGDGGGGDGGG